LNEVLGAREGDVQSALTRVKAALANPGDPLRLHLRGALEIPPVSVAERVMVEISGQRDGCSRGDLLELLAMSGEVSVGQYDAALALLERLGCLLSSSEVVRPSAAAFWCRFLFSNVGAAAAK